MEVGNEAMNGVAPELHSGWVHRRINTESEVRHAPDSSAPRATQNKQQICT